MASPSSYVDSNDPAFLILYATGESKGLQRQSQRLPELLEQAGVDSQVIAVPGESHARMVLTLSRSDKTAAPAMLKFLSTLDCRGRGTPHRERLR